MDFLKALKNRQRTMYHFQSTTILDNWNDCPRFVPKKPAEWLEMASKVVWRSSIPYKISVAKPILDSKGQLS
jgi:hypothetical protein